MFDKHFTRISPDLHHLLVVTLISVFFFPHNSKYDYGIHKDLRKMCLWLHQILSLWPTARMFSTPVLGWEYTYSRVSLCSKEKQNSLTGIC